MNNLNPPKCPLCKAVYKGGGVLEKIKLEGLKYVEYHRCTTRGCEHIFPIDKTKEIGEDYQ